jgi:hypothetical protein
MKLNYTTLHTNKFKYLVHYAIILSLFFFDRATSVQYVSFSQVKETLSHSTVYILPKTPTHYKALTNTHITKPTHTHTYKTI